MNIDMVILLVVGFAAGFAVSFAMKRKSGATTLAEAEKVAAQLLEDSKKQVETSRKESELQAKDLVYQARAEWEAEAKELRREIQGQEKRVLQKESLVDRKAEQLDDREQELTGRDRDLVRAESVVLEKQQAVESLHKIQTETLENISDMSAEEAKKTLMNQMESEAKHDAAKRIKQIEDEARDTADYKSKEILSLAIQRYAGDYVAEKTVSVVSLPSDEMKGRIIGREGRNIRAIEAVTGVDLIIDDTPEAVIISGFNPVRREVARIALERLIADGRIHPSRIEEVVTKAEQEVDLAIREAGQQATFDVGVHGIHPEIIKLIGRLKYRTSYGQNVLQHSLEVSFLCGIMASELGLNVKEAKRAGLLHDIGKAVDHEIEGSHAVIGADLARKYGETKAIVHALAAHHEDEKPETILAVLVQAADALSGARPGARREIVETYVKRLQDLEQLGASFAGVESCYAIQAGREIRVMVSSEKVTDAHAHVLAKDIAAKIEKDMTYPGQIRVNVIRETRAVEYAK